jgi:hypothetical protein
MNQEHRSWHEHPATGGLSTSGPSPRPPPTLRQRPEHPGHRQALRQRRGIAELAQILRLWEESGESDLSYHANP